MISWPYAKDLLRKFHLGKLGGSPGVQFNSSEPKQPTQTLLKPKIWKKVTFFEKKIISHNSRVFHFSPKHPHQTSGLPVGKHIYIRTKGPDGKFVMIQYTPKSRNREEARLDVLIKVYFPRDNIPGDKF
jgi:hypothetical protein